MRRARLYIPRHFAVSEPVAYLKSELANHPRIPDRHLRDDRAATAESKNIEPIYVEILEQRSRVFCGLFEAARPVCNSAVWPYPCG